MMNIGDDRKNWLTGLPHPPAPSRTRGEGEKPAPLPHWWGTSGAQGAGWLRDGGVRIRHLALCSLFVVLSACTGLPGAQPAGTPTPVPPLARENAAVATAEAGGDPLARADAYYERGNAQFDAGEYDTAIEDYGRAIQLDPRHARAFNNRALAQAALGRNAEALADYSQAIALDPGYVRAYQNRLRLLEQQGDLKAMAADYARLAALDQANAADYLYHEGSALHGLRNFAGARRAYDAALAANPQHVDALYERALLSFAEHKLPAAIVDLDQAIGLSPRAANARYARGLAWSAQGDQPRAINDFSRALELQPGYAEALLARASAYHAAKDDAQARVDLDALGKLDLDEGLKAAAEALRRQVGG